MSEARLQQAIALYTAGQQVAAMARLLPYSHSSHDKAGSRSTIEEYVVNYFDALLFASYADAAEGAAAPVAAARSPHSMPTDASLLGQ